MKRWLCLLLFSGWPLAVAALPQLELAVRLDPARRAFEAQAMLADREPITVFRLDPTFEILSLSADGRAIAVRRRLGSTDQYLLPRGTRRIALRYRAVLPPTPAVDHRQALRPQATASLEGSFLPASTAWYPQIDGFFHFRITLDLPAGQKGLVPGTLLAEEETTEGYHARFEFPWPADGIELMAGPYVVSERWLTIAAKKIRLRTYFHRELEELASAYLADSARYLERYSDEIGPYPFDSFSVVSSPLPTGFGMPTLTYLGREVLRLPFIRATSLGHEVLHNWWGNGVYPDWRSGNWSEGLTTFMADYAYKEEESEEAARAMRLGWLRDYAAVPAREDFALTDFRARHHGIASIIGYNKAAMVFLMLRDRIGREAFRRGLQTFWQRHRFKTASWRDLEAAFSEASGRNLRPFFAEWVEKAGPAVLSPEEVARDRDYRLWRKLPREELPPILREVLIAPAVDFIVLDAELEAATPALLARLLDDRTPRRAANPGERPFVVIGKAASIVAWLARQRLSPAPPLPAAGTARVWAGRTAQHVAYLVIEVENAEALSALQRPLPHYGKEGWLVFDGRRVLAKGLELPGKIRP